MIFAKLPVTLEPDPVDLARRAIMSARGTAGQEGRDGISYLMGVKANGVTTPLSPAYEREILRQPVPLLCRRHSNEQSDRQSDGPHLAVA